jgi:tetratricopeptide (TPR) repeat protein
MARFQRTVWNELHGLTPQEIELIKRFESDARGSLFMAAADILRKRGYIDEAVVIMEEGLKLFPQYHTARASLGRDYFLKGMMHEAQTHLSNVVQKSADNAMAQRLKLKLDIVFDKFDAVHERLAIIKKVIPDDDFTKSVRSLMALNNWSAVKSLMRAELERLGIQWSWENEREAIPAVSERLQNSKAEEAHSAWELPAQFDSTDTQEATKVSAPEQNTPTPPSFTEIPSFQPDLDTSAADSSTFTYDIPEPPTENELRESKLSEAKLDESQLPQALRTGPTLANVRGDAERYLALKGFRRLQAEGLFSTMQNTELRKQSLDGETLAEIYATQGLLAKSITIYERLVQAQPEVQHYQKRLSELSEAFRKQEYQKHHSQSALPLDETQSKALRMSEAQEKKLRLLERLLNKLDTPKPETAPTS